MTEARDEALKCLELAKQAKAQTYRDSEIDLQVGSISDKLYLRISYVVGNLPVP